MPPNQERNPIPLHALKTQGSNNSMISCIANVNVCSKFISPLILHTRNAVRSLRYNHYCMLNRRQLCHGPRHIDNTINLVLGSTDKNRLQDFTVEELVVVLIEVFLSLKLLLGVMLRFFLINEIQSLCFNFPIDNRPDYTGTWGTDQFYALQPAAQEEIRRNIQDFLGFGMTIRLGLALLVFLGSFEGSGTREEFVGNVGLVLALIL